MLKGAIIFLFGLLAGAAAGGMTVLFYYPFWFPPAEVNETVHAAAAKQVVGNGQFIHPDPSDTVHWGKGTLTVYQGNDGLEFFMGPDFEVGPGPDYHVYLINRTDITKPEQFDPESANELGRLKSFKGGQIYTAAAGEQLAGSSLVVWCKRFRQLITTANIQQ